MNPIIMNGRVYQQMKDIPKNERGQIASLLMNAPIDCNVL